MYLERDMLTSQPDLKLLASVLVLLWPLRVVFPIGFVSATLLCVRSEVPKLDVLHDLALLDDSFDLLDH